MFGLIRLTSEISTPFLNQRWFFKTIGGDGAEYRVATITLFFFSTFCLGRYFLALPYWYVFVSHFNTPPHRQIAADLPRSVGFFICLPAMLDCLNIVWGIPVLAITKKALRTLRFLPPAQKKEKVDDEQQSNQQNGTVLESDSGRETPYHDYNHCNGTSNGTVPHAYTNGL
ncbi:unnamed protein product [Dibothriocephalus latus]|uniref:TLC domain-containing protein n=1 Tax=Dibothriocephalus latus TaxID=60516 RepID=A0A3P7PSK7_DIBLA|nr:unnamed protein product [Dibothriocephalus latus]